MENQIEQVKQKTDIVAIIGERIKLTKAGKHYKALCPFHGEKTPSFTVSPELQIFKCFGCGESGDAYSFLEKFEGMEFGEALKYLADRAGIKLIRLNIGDSDEKQILLSANDLAAKYYHYLLTKHNAGKKALLYVLQTRGINKDSIETFNLGFAPDNQTALKQFLIKRKYKLVDLEKAGLVAYGKDRFRGRLIFPLQNQSGTVVGLAGRIMPGPAADKIAKYINSPETPIYHKSSILYGLNLTRPYIKKANQAIVVEGEIDLISSYQVGIKNIVAIKGTALTEEQVRILSRLCSEIILALDADLAGDAASRRGIAIAQNAGLNIRVMRQSKFKDPDELARNDPQGYKKALEEAIDIWDFFITSAITKYDSSTGAGKSAISRDLIPLFSQITDEIVLAHYISELAGKINVPPEAVSSQIEKYKKTSKVETVIASENKEPGRPSREQLLEEQLLSFAFASTPDILLTLSDVEIKSNFAKKLILRLQEFLNNKDKQYSPKEFSDFLSEELRDKFNLLILSGQLEDLTDFQYKVQIENTLRELKRAQLQSKLSEISVQISQSEGKDSQDLASLEVEFAEISDKLADLVSD